MRYGQDFVERVRSSNDIVDVVSEYIPLKRAGRNFKALSPFKSEKTPSFMVSSEKQIFHCFSTGIGGDVFGFLMKYENLSFPEAVRKLAERANLPIPEDAFRSDPNKRSEKEKLFEAYGLAADFYHDLFVRSEKGKTARGYYLKREFPKPLAKEFKIGWAPDEWTALTDHLKKKGFREEFLVNARLANKSDRGRVYDMFRARLLFPIQNLQGKVVAFGGRLIGKGDGPKYLNSPENPVFVKRRELFNLNRAKLCLDREMPRLLVVEGYVDALRLYEKGFKNVVATLGTSLTPEHVALLKRYVQEVIVIYDGDVAGQDASLRGLEIFLEGGLNVRLIAMPENEDPDDFLKKNGPEAFQKALDQAADFFDYKLKLLEKRFKKETPSGLMKISQECLSTLTKVKNPVLLDFYLKKLAQSLSIEETSMRAELKQISSKMKPVEARKQKPQEKPVSESSLSAVPRNEVILFALMMESREWCTQAFESLSETDFDEPSLRDFFRQLVLSMDTELQPSFSQLLQQVTDDDFRQKIITESAILEDVENKDKVFEDCLKSLKRRKWEKRLKEIQRKIQEAEASKNQNQAVQSMKEYQETLKHIKELPL